MHFQVLYFILNFIVSLCYELFIKLRITIFSLGMLTTYFLYSIHSLQQSFEIIIIKSF